MGKESFYKTRKTMCDLLRDSIYYFVFLILSFDHLSLSHAHTHFTNKG